MTTAEIAHHTSTDLVIASEQNRFTEAQVAMLRQVGIEDAPDGDLQVFFHHCKRSGLDPFARQIYMIPRETDVRVRVQLPGGGSRVESQRMTKYTIQTGIDGYRLIGKRAAARENALVSHDDPQWVGKEGVWRDFWAKTEGTPVAAKYTIRVNGAPYTATCMFDEFAQYSGKGELTSMWKKMPANQLAVRAEAAAWRKAFPADFSDIHEAGGWQVIDEAGSPASGRQQGAALVTAEEILGESAESLQQKPRRESAKRAQEPPEQPAAPPSVDQIKFTDAERRKGLNMMFALFAEADIPKDDREDRLIITAAVIGESVESSNDLTDPQLYTLVNTLRTWKEAGTLGGEVTEVLNQAALKEMEAEQSAAESETDSPATEKE